MPRKQRMYLPGVPAHVVQRGNNRDACFFQDEDYQFYLAVLADALRRYRVHLHAYLLMTNHVHIQVVTKRLTDFMKGFLQSYVRWYNIKNQTNDKLFKTPFNSTSKKSEKWIRKP